MEETLIDLNYDSDKQILTKPSYYDLEQLIVAQNYKIKELENTIKTVQQSVEFLKKMHSNFVITINYINYSEYFASNIGTVFSGYTQSIKTKRISIETEELDFSNMILDMESVTKIKHLFNLKRVKTHNVAYNCDGPDKIRISNLKLFSYPDLPGFPYMYDHNMNPEQKPLQIILL
jgi:hypothetical protein